MNVPFNVEPNGRIHSGDIDLFIVGLTEVAVERSLRGLTTGVVLQEQARVKVLKIVEHLRRVTNSDTIMRSNHCITHLGVVPFRHCQIVLRLYRTAAEVIVGFDVDACCVAFDGTRVFMLPRAHRVSSGLCNAPSCSTELCTVTRRR